MTPARARRLAELHREIAEVYAEEAGEAGAVVDLRAPTPRRRQPPVAPPGEVTELDRARAKRALERIGVRVVTKGRGGA